MMAGAGDFYLPCSACCAEDNASEIANRCYRCGAGKPYAFSAQASWHEGSHNSFKGVSITVPAHAWKGALSSAVIDHSRIFGLIRIGERLRVSGSAEVTGYDTVPSPVRCKALTDKVLEIFPEFQACLDAGEPLLWAGLRANTPDVVPILGNTPLANLFLNAGHGPEGWPTSCGSARLVAAAVVGEKPPIDMAGLEQSRFQ